MEFRRKSGLAAASLLLFCASGWADTISLPLTDDAFILGVRPTTNYGTWDDIFVTSYGPKQGLVRFDAASIAGQEVNSATLKLYLNEIAAGGTISIHAITSSWSESTVNWDNQPPAEATATAVVELATADEGSAISIDVTDVVERWADGNLADGGFLIVTSDGIKAYFDTKEMAGGVPATLTVDTGPAVSDGRAIVLDFTVSDNCTIDEPGYYILDRSWDFSAPGPTHACPENQVTIETDGVVLDLRGYSLKNEDIAAIILTGNYRVTIRNGSLDSLFQWAILGDTGGEVLLENMQIVGNVQTGGGSVLNSSITNTNYSWPRALRVLGCATTESCIYRYSTFTCRGAPSHCVAISTGAAGEFRNNRISSNGGGLEFSGADAGIVTNNVIELRDFPERVTNPNQGIVVVASRTTVAHNILINNSGDEGVGEGIRIFGGPTAAFSENIVEGNIVRGAWLGLFFNDSTGNFFGNNRISATIPFQDTEGQTDWGGNVSF